MSTSRATRVLLLPALALAAAFVTASGVQAQAAPAAREPEPVNPLHTKACRDAMSALEDRERALSAASAARAPDTLNAVRRRAAIACLGRADSPPPQHLAQPPQPVAPVIVPARPVEPAAPATSLPAARGTPPPPMPPTVTSCDATGCWTSDGTRLLRNGPDLVGPRGLCSVVGGVLRCP